MKSWLIPTFCFVLSFAFLGISWAQATGEMQTVIGDKTAISIGLVLTLIGTATFSVRKLSKYDSHIADSAIHKDGDQLNSRFVARNECTLMNSAIVQRLDNLSTAVEKLDNDIGDINEGIARLEERSKNG